MEHACQPVMEIWLSAGEDSDGLGEPVQADRRGLGLEHAVGELTGRAIAPANTLSARMTRGVMPARYLLVDGLVRVGHPGAAVVRGSRG